MQVCVDLQGTVAAARRDAEDICRSCGLLRREMDEMERTNGSVEVLQRVAEGLESRIVRGHGDAPSSRSYHLGGDAHRRDEVSAHDASVSISHLPSLSPSSSPLSREPRHRLAPDARWQDAPHTGSAMDMSCIKAEVGGADDDSLLSYLVAGEGASFRN